MRVALATVGTAGDVRPFAALAAALAVAGHEVSAVSWEPHRTAFEGTGARFEPAGPPTTAADISATAERAAAVSSPTGQVAVLRDFHLRDGAAHVRQLRDALAGHDLAVIHGIHSLAQAAAGDIGLPWASAVFDPVLLPTGSAPPAGMPNLGPLNPLAWRFLDRMLGPLDAPLQAVLAEAGSTARPPLFRGRSTLLHLVACSPTIIRVPPDLPATTHVTGAWPPPEGAPLTPELSAFLDAGEPPVVVTFGSMRGASTSQLTASIVAASRALGRRVVLQGGEHETANDVISVGETDHRRLFPRGAAVVHHGGAGTTQAVVAAGVPSVVVPHVGDQRYWAQRLRVLNVAPPPVTRKSATPRDFQDRLRTAIDSLTPAAREVGARVRAEAGLYEAVRLIESI
jgi:UDP:flavonoid glycosyltransferase YjiC (YdhE family)